jgi:membrane associated rhomboid family serine protease
MSFYRQGPYRPAGVGIGVPELTPYAKGIIIASVAVWIVQFLLLVGFRIDLSPVLGVVPLRVLGGWLWQVLSYVFLHDPAGPLHILFNMLMLWMFGGELERLWGGRAFLRFYLVCGAGAGVCITLAGLLSGGVAAITPTVGASGALFGLFVAFGTIFARRTILFMLFFPMQARTMVWILIGLNLYYLLSLSDSPFSAVAHLGGALTGFLYLKRAWRVADLFRELRWRIRRRKFKMVSPDEPDDRWTH